MKITYALIAACLSLQACNDQVPTASFDTSADIYVDEYNVGAVAPPAAAAPSIEEQYAAYWIDTTRDDHTATLPATSRFDDDGIDWSIDTDDHSATVTSPAGKPSEDKAVAAAPDFYLDDEGFALMLPAPIDLHAIQATDWW